MENNLKNFSIKTERLKLVSQSLQFLETTHAYASDRENMRYTLNLPNDSEEDTREFLLSAEAEWEKDEPSFYEFAILKDGKHIGGLSLYPDETGTCAELGWCLDKSVQGKGYAVEAARAVVAWAKETISISRFIAHCDSENIASWKTMEKLEMKRVSCTGGRFNKLNPTEERNEFLYEM